MESYLIVYLLLGWLASCALCVGLVWGIYWILITYIKITKDKELFNLFNHSGILLCGREAIDHAITKGARKVFCFDGFLRKYYERWGFVEVKREDWSEDLAPAGWDYETYGRPCMVWLEIPVDFDD
jgi:hypothetical protein